MRRKLALLGVVVLALPVVASAAAPSPGTYRGKVVQDSGKVSFSVSANGRKLLKFKINGVGATCPGGFQLITVYVPSARITATGRFSAKYKPVAGTDQTVQLAGRFVTRTRATGTVKAGDLCVYREKWNATKR